MALNVAVAIHEHALTYDLRIVVENSSDVGLSDSELFGRFFDNVSLQ